MIICFLPSPANEADVEVAEGSTSPPEPEADVPRGSLGYLYCPVEKLQTFPGASDPSFQMPGLDAESGPGDQEETTAYPVRPTFA
ncbi:unnamed protein product [Boreogadus saida]